MDMMQSGQQSRLAGEHFIKGEYGGDVKINMPCKFGVRCSRPGCWYQHPEGRAMDMMQTPKIELPEGAEELMCGLAAASGGLLPSAGLMNSPTREDWMPDFAAVLAKMRVKEGKIGTDWSC